MNAKRLSNLDTISRIHVLFTTSKRMSKVRNLSKVLGANYFRPSSYYKWYNQLGSTMTVTDLDKSKGSFFGKYCSAVGDAKCEYDLIGRIDMEGDTLGWVVTYRNDYLNAHSTCTWSGHWEWCPGKESKLIILTTWLLTSQTRNEDDWAATNIGFDIFTTNPPSKEQIAKARLCRQFSHPKKAFME